jgi:hypothetical protein
MAGAAGHTTMSNVLNCTAWSTRQATQACAPGLPGRKLDPRSRKLIMRDIASSLHRRANDRKNKDRDQRRSRAIPSLTVLRPLDSVAWPLGGVSRLTPNALQYWSTHTACWALSYRNALMFWPWARGKRKAVKW